MFRCGLIGEKLSHSFSKKYFDAKFERLRLPNHFYELHELTEPASIKKLAEKEGFKGCNVTIPYKEQIIPFLDELSEEAAEVGAVNTIALLGSGLKGYNTDVFGFEQSLKPLLQDHHQRAIILGRGGASKAVQFVLKKMGIEFSVFNRKEAENVLSFEQLEAEICEYHQLIINTTPLGQWPDTDSCPPLKYEAIRPSHLIYDLVYNPCETHLLKQCSARGATTCNGYQMLVLQAEKAWKIWTTNSIDS